MGESLGRNWIDISPKTLFEMLEERRKGNQNFTLLDVRNPNEQDIAVIPGTDILIPWNQILLNQNLLPEKTEKIVVYCKSGIRSEKACQILREAGFTDLLHLSLGILGYAREVDPEMPEY